MECKNLGRTLLFYCSTSELPRVFEANLSLSLLPRLLFNPFLVPSLLTVSHSSLLHHLFSLIFHTCPPLIPSPSVALIPACLSLSISPRAANSSPSAVTRHFNALCAPHITPPSFLSIIPFIPLSALSEMMSTDTRPYPQPLSSLEVCDPHAFSVSLLLLFICHVCAPSALLYGFSCLSLLSARNGDFLEEMIKI